MGPKRRKIGDILDEEDARSQEAYNILYAGHLAHLNKHVELTNLEEQENLVDTDEEDLDPILNFSWGTDESGDEEEEEEEEEVEEKEEVEEEEDCGANFDEAKSEDGQAMLNAFTLPDDIISNDSLSGNATSVTEAVIVAENITENSTVNATLR